jgi:hypothetical protein
MYIFSPFFLLVSIHHSPLYFMVSFFFLLNGGINMRRRQLTSLLPDPGRFYGQIFWKQFEKMTRKFGKC